MTRVAGIAASVLALACAACLLSLGSALARGSAAGRGAIRVGSVLVRHCSVSPSGWCGEIQVPLDYFDPRAGTIRLGFQWYPARDGHAAGTILAVQGGPGYPTTAYAEAYRGVFGHGLLASRNMLLVDLRGTGSSSSFVCRALQNWSLNDGTIAYAADTGACARQLDHNRLEKGSNQYVQASGLYTTANSARDVALLLGELGTGPVDFYGDSYGTFFGQVFTARYPQLLRSVTLDSAYPVSQQNPFYPATIRTARYAFNVSCLRSVACRQQAPGSSWSRVVLAASYLRAHPVRGTTRTPTGSVVRTTVGVNELIELVNLAGSDSGVYRELDPALRALLHGDDPVPLLRLTTQEITPSAGSGPISQFNDGLYQATTCLDYPQPFTYASPLAGRISQYRHAVDALAPHTFAPFTVTEWVGQPAEEFDACLRWPAPVRPDPPITTPPPYAPSTLPVLVLSGDLDSLTTPVEGLQTARDMGPSARWILIRNDTHINAMDDTFGCASSLVRRFIEQPAGLRQLNSSCVTRTPEVRVLGSFPRLLADIAPALPHPGNRSGPVALRLAAVAVAATGDAVWRWYYSDGVNCWGLRGGTCSYSGPAAATRIVLHGIRWTDDTSVSGRVLWNSLAGGISAQLTVSGPVGTALVDLRYRDYAPHPRATITGSFGNLAIRASIPAP